MFNDKTLSLLNGQWDHWTISIICGSIVRGIQGLTGVIVTCLDRKQLDRSRSWYPKKGTSQDLRSQDVCVGESNGTRRVGRSGTNRWEEVLQTSQWVGVCEEKKKTGVRLRGSPFLTRSRLHRTRHYIHFTRLDESQPKGCRNLSH